ncbi:MAG: N-acetyltransferase family protein [Nocardioidaceae bacterium]
MQSSVAIRPAGPADLDQIAAIYNHEVLTGISTFDVEPQPVDQWQAQLASERPGDQLLVAVVADSAMVLGYAYSSPYRTRPAYRRTRETSIYLAESARGRGIGRVLYADLLDRLRADSMHTALALVAEPNPASRRMHLSLGFEQVGTLREVGHKFGEYIDITWYQKLLADE